MRTLFLAKSTEWCHVAERWVKTHLPGAVCLMGENGDPLPEVARNWSGDYILSFVSPWIVPEDVLARASRAALNFHPGPPEYPGIGCYNFALYQGAAEYGVTCHHMAVRVDTGDIVAVERFPVLSSDSVQTLKDRSMAAMLTLLFEIVERIAGGDPLPQSAETWQRRPFTRRELNELGRVTPEMAEAEVRRRVRAMAFPDHPGAFVELAGFRFQSRD